MIGEVRHRVTGDGNVAIPTHFPKFDVERDDADDVQALPFLPSDERTVDRDSEDFLDHIKELSDANSLFAYAGTTSVPSNEIRLTTYGERALR